ncbi:MAG: FAD:protein transferase [Acidobacteriota bacterium]|jgi:thiamine biosynthesis lipoprotein|nr:FAD:protein transferase [Acidobacteriota bacterium]
MLSLSLLLLLQVQIQASPQEIRPVRVAATSFGKPAEIEVRDLPRETARVAIQSAFDEIAEIERLTRPDALNAGAGQGPQALDPRLMPLLVRAQEFCFWSEGAHGPLGWDLYEAWGLHGAGPAGAPPEPPDTERLERAKVAARCDTLRLNPSKGTAELATGARLDLGGFAEGHAVDRAVEVLRQKGVGNGFVQIGGVQRAFGGGVDGRGWKVLLPEYPGRDRASGLFLLHDRAAAVFSIEDNPLKIADQAMLPYLHQRTGLPAAGVAGVAAVTDLAVDAQALAIAMALTGPREGQLRLGSLRPSPSVLWFLGNGSGTPLQVDHRWGEIIAASR